MPMLAPAPGRLSTTTVCPNPSVSFCASSRATMSVPPAGGNGTRMRSGRCGYCCWATATPLAAAHKQPAIATAASLLTMDARICDSRPDITLPIPHRATEDAFQLVFAHIPRRVPDHALLRIRAVGERIEVAFVVA